MICSIVVFKVACYATQHPASLVPRSVGPSVGPSVTLYFFGFLQFLVADKRLYTLPCRSVRPSLSPSIHWSHFQIPSSFRPTAPAKPSATGLPCIRPFWPHCSCSNDLVTSITAPAHPHATGAPWRLSNFCVTDQRTCLLLVLLR